MTQQVEESSSLQPIDIRWRRRTAIEMAISGVVGLFVSMVLSVEAWLLALDENATFSCDVSSVLSCTAVAKSWQATLLGFPNAFIGIFFEAVVLAISVALLAGVRFPRWYMLGAQILYSIALFFALWLFAQSYFVLHVMCPWCLLITLTTTLVWAGLTRINIVEENLPSPQGLRHFVRRGLDWAITGLFIFALAAMLIARYGALLFIS